MLPKDELTFKAKASIIWAEFYYWSYDQENFWKASCQKPDRATRMVIFDESALDRFKITHLLKDWWLKDKGDDLKVHRVKCQCEHCKVMLTKNMRGVAECCTVDVVKMFYGLQPSVARAIVRAMNEVLEA